jgi:hypothetical protein
MLRVAVFLLLLFSILLVLRAIRALLSFLFGSPARPPAAPREIAGEMIRDPVCGTWVDRRLALPAGQGNAVVAVCSQKCREALESSRS